MFFRKKMYNEKFKPILVIQHLKWNSFTRSLLIHFLSSKVKSTNFFVNWNFQGRPVVSGRWDRALTLKINTNKSIDLCGASPDSWLAIHTYVSTSTYSYFSAESCTHHYWVKWLANIFGPERHLCQPNQPKKCNYSLYSIVTSW